MTQPTTEPRFRIEIAPVNLEAQDITPEVAVDLRAMAREFEIRFIFDGSPALVMTGARVTLVGSGVQAIAEMMRLANIDHAALIEVAKEAQDWLRQSPYLNKQGRGDRDMADKLYEALEPYT